METKKLKTIINIVIVVISVLYFLLQNKIDKLVGSIIDILMFFIVCILITHVIVQLFDAVQKKFSSKKGNRDRRIILNKRYENLQLLKSYGHMLSIVVVFIFFLVVIKEVKRDVPIAQNFGYLYSGLFILSLIIGTVHLIAKNMEKKIVKKLNEL